MFLASMVQSMTTQERIKGELPIGKKRVIFFDTEQSEFYVQKVLHRVFKIIGSTPEHFEAYYKLSVDHREWIQADNLTFHTDACINLWRIYSSIAASIEEEDPQESLDYLIKALKLATESKLLTSWCIIFLLC